LFIGTLLPFISEQRRRIPIKNFLNLQVSDLFAIGTSHGLVLVYDQHQQLRVILGTTEGIDHGPVTAVDVAPSHDWLVCGHQDGQLVIWDIATGSIVKSFTAHQNPIVFLRFAKDKLNIISTDTNVCVPLVFDLKKEN
jgi:WD40 repeat protein